MPDEVHILIEHCEIERDSEKSCFNPAVVLMLIALVTISSISWLAMIKYFIISKFVIVISKFLLIMMIILFLISIK